MKIALSFLLASALFATVATAGTTYKIQFFNDKECNMKSYFVTLTSPQTAQSCHQFAVEHALSEVSVLSYGQILHSTEWGDQYLCSQKSDLGTFTFEEACAQAFAH